MTWIRRGLILVAALLLAVAAYAIANALRTTRPVGFQWVSVPDADGTTLAVGVWYPTEATPRPTTLLGLNLLSVAPQAPIAGTALPLVVISHGNGGGPGSHADLALALAENGFVVAAPMHTGDNFADQRSAGTARWLPDRHRHLRATLDHLLGAWPGRDRINPARIGIFGFSAGGFSALAAIGGTPDLSRVALHCSASDEFVCRLLRQADAPLLRPGDAPPPSAFARDTRLKAAVLAAPGLGFAFPPEALGRVTVPVQLWSGLQDANVPEPTNAGPIRQGLGPRVEFHAVPGAAHFSFLVPCRLLGPPLLCRDADGFDRIAFHASMNAQVVAFFGQHL